MNVHTQRVLDETTVPPALKTVVGVGAKDVQAGGVVSVNLVSVIGEPLPDWTTGVDADFVIDGKTTRQYSLLWRTLVTVPTTGSASC